jgi:hypothetical protein
VFDASESLKLRVGRTLSSRAFQQDSQKIVLKWSYQWEHPSKATLMTNL